MCLAASRKEPRQVCITPNHRQNHPYTGASRLKRSFCSSVSEPYTNRPSVFTARRRRRRRSISFFMIVFAPSLAHSRREHRGACDLCQRLRAFNFFRQPHPTPRSAINGHLVPMVTAWLCGHGLRMNDLDLIGRDAVLIDYSGGTVNSCAITSFGVASSHKLGRRW
jgi:hypothetical protein